MSSPSVSLPRSYALRGFQEACETSAGKPALVPSDEELMELVQKGNHEAFGQVLGRYYIVVRSVARKMLRNPEDAADVVQESLLDIYQNARSFSPARGTLKAWISCLTYHRALKRLTLLRRRDRESGDLDKAESLVKAGRGPEQWIRQLDFRRSLDTVLGTLQEKQRRATLLYFFEGKELSAIAVELRESLGNTRHHLYRGLTKLRRELVQKGLLQGYIEFVDDRNVSKVAD